MADCALITGITGQDISIRALAEKIAERMDYTGAFTWDASRPNGQPKRRLNVERARDRFGFEADVALDEGLMRTLEWWEREARS